MSSNKATVNIDGIDHGVPRHCETCHHWVRDDTHTMFGICKVFINTTTGNDGGECQAWKMADVSRLKKLLHSWAVTVHSSTYWDEHHSIKLHNTTKS